MCKTWSSCMHMTVIRMRLSIKPQATVYETKTTNMHNCNTESAWVRLASPACMSCLVCMVADAHGSSTPCALQALAPTCSSVWPLERSVHVTCDFQCEWAIVATQTMALTDETFLPWGSPYRSSH